MATVIQNGEPSNNGNPGVLLAVVAIIILILGFFAYFGFNNAGNTGNTAPAPEPDVNTTEVETDVIPEQPTGGDVNIDVPDEIDVNVDNQE